MEPLLSSPGSAGSQIPVLNAASSEMLTAFAHLYLSQAKPWFLAIVNKQDCFPFHQQSPLGDSCNSLVGGWVGTRSMGRVPRSGQAQGMLACPVEKRSITVRLSEGNHVFPSRQAQRALRCSSGTCGVLGRGRRVRGRQGTQCPLLESCGGATDRAWSEAKAQTWPLPECRTHTAHTRVHTPWGERGR